jgi:hypothetical protein
MLNRSRTFWKRWKSLPNHNPNVLKRSLVCLVEATNSQISGKAKYARNASMKSSEANERRRPPPRATRALTP